MWLNSTHSINCCVSTTTMVMRMRDNITLYEYLHYLHCKKFIKTFVLKPSWGNLGVYERTTAKGS